MFPVMDHSKKLCLLKESGNALTYLKVLTSE